MPLLKIHTNRTVTPAVCDTLLQQASATVARQLGKSQNYVMVSISQGLPMLFAGTTEPLAYLELKSINLPEERTAEISQALCEVVGESLAIDRNRIYIEFSNAARHLWGWNGTTF